MATTNPNNPVYERESLAATAQYARINSELEARTDHAGGASPNARIPYTPDSQDEIEKRVVKDRKDIVSCAKNEVYFPKESTVGRHGENEAEAKRLTEIVISTMRRISEKAVMNRKDRAELEERIQGSDWTEQEVRVATEQIIEPLNEFHLAQAGNILTVFLSAEIDNIREEKAEQAEQARLLELAQKQAAESTVFQRVEEFVEETLPTLEELLTGEEH